METRPCTTMRDSENIHEQSSLQKYTTCWVFLAFVNRKFVFLYSPIWLMGMSFLISLNNPLFKNIQHVGSFWYFIICCICVFVFLYLHVWFMEISFLISLNNPLFKNIQHVGAFWYFVICCICVFVCLCICIFVFVCLIHGNIIFDILEHSSFQKYTTCWGFLVLCYMLY